MLGGRRSRATAGPRREKYCILVETWPPFPRPSLHRRRRFLWIEDVKEKKLKVTHLY